MFVCLFVFVFVFVICSMAGHGVICGSVRNSKEAALSVSDLKGSNFVFPK